MAYACEKEDTGVRKAPTRPPNRSRNGGRPPRGPRTVALRPEDNERVQQLTQASAYLRTLASAADASDEAAQKAPELKDGVSLRKMADAVDFVMTPEGRSFVNRLRVQRLREEEAEGKYGQNLAIAMPLAVREDIKERVAKAAKAAQKEERERAAAEGREPKKVTVSIPAEAQKSLEAFLAGEFVPERPQRAARGTAGKVGNLNVRVDPDLRQRAEDFGADNAARFGWAPRASHVIAAWLIGKFTQAEAEPAE